MAKLWEPLLLCLRSNTKLLNLKFKNLKPWPNALDFSRVSCRERLVTLFSDVDWCSAPGGGGDHHIISYLSMVAHSTKLVYKGSCINVEGMGMCHPYGWVFWAQNFLSKGPFFGFSINMGGSSRNWQKIAKTCSLSAKIHHKNGYDSKFR